ncbi:MAG: type III secretion protein, partial [Acidobacteria bacterium]
MTPITVPIPFDGLLPAFALMLRISAFVAVAPIVGSVAVPVRARIALAFVLTVLLAPVAPAPRATAGPGTLVAGELLVGLLLGTAARAIVEAATYAGGLAGYPAGLAIAAVLDPVTQQQMPTLAIFYRLLALVAYLTLGGHREFLAVLARSYEIVPVGGSTLAQPWLPGAVALTGRVLVLGLRLAAPILVAGLLVDLCLMLV